MIGRIFAPLVFPTLVLTLFALNAASAEDIAVGNYGSSANGMPFGVALPKDTQQEGANVTGIIFRGAVRRFAMRWLALPMGVQPWRDCRRVSAGR